MHIGIIREGKTPPDKRVPLTPEQCTALLKKYPELKITVQKSAIRAITDQEYEAAGLSVVESVDNADLIIGVKEVNLDDLIPNKKFMFFSHTFKKQPYNRKLLKTVLDKKIELIDYEVLTRSNGQRIIGFGRYAGIVGCYNGFLAYGKKTGRYELKPAHQCFDRVEMESELAKVDLPNNFKMILTGKGRVGNGALEIINKIGLDQVSADQILMNNDQPVYASLDVVDYNMRSSDEGFDKKEFYQDASDYVSTFPRFISEVDMYVACHYWGANAPFIFTREDLKMQNRRLSVVADISCDIDGPVASTIRPSTIADPLYGYDPLSENETDFMDPNSIGVMAVDNLPCELPRDASKDFGNELVNNVIPHLLGDDTEKIIFRATETTLDGKLNEPYQYLEKYIAGEE